MSPRRGIWDELPWLTVCGGLGFWLANFAISRTEVAADYRSALSIAYVPMLLEALAGGLILGALVSFCLLRFFDEIPTHGSISKSIVLSAAAWLVVTVLIEVPAKFLGPVHDVWRYFLIGLAFNALRILALGIVVGYLHQRVAARS